MRNIFTEHPHAMGETYFQHMQKALRFSLGMFLSAGIYFIHGFFPFLFQTNGSRLLLKMAEEHIARARKSEKTLDNNTKH